jgi:hypothetical protein
MFLRRWHAQLSGSAAYRVTPIAVSRTLGVGLAHLPVGGSASSDFVP